MVGTRQRSRDGKFFLALPSAMISLPSAMTPLPSVAFSKAGKFQFFCSFPFHYNKYNVHHIFSFHETKHNTCRIDIHIQSEKTYITHTHTHIYIYHINPSHKGP